MYLEVFKPGEMFDLRFIKINDNKKSMIQNVGSYTLTCELDLM